ncbi:amino acid adenylation domain-containing protein [Streptomyces sp. NPDC093223]|uniref:non-ribosomal peptide synthetase n=1 Tax=Streptomyces sp. NPDC093223 TaxID=3366033 RepID=UPI0037F1E757
MLGQDPSMGRHAHKIPPASGKLSRIGFAPVDSAAAHSSCGTTFENGCCTFMLPEDLPQFGARAKRTFRAFPASAVQQRMYVLEQEEEGGSAYHIPVFCALEGPVDEAVIRSCAQELLDRHEALRTRFVIQDGTLWQHIDFAVELAWSCATATGTAQIDSWMSGEHHRRFDVESGPLFRAALLHTDGGAVLSLVMHRIVADGWSGDILVRELLTSYARSVEAGTGGQDTPAPLERAPAPSYADYSEWQREWLRGVGARGQLAYWEDQLGGDRADALLPRDRRPAPRPDHGAGLHSFDVPAPVAARLEALCRDAHCTPYVLMLAVFQAVLGRYTGSEDVLVGTAVANRDREEFKDTVGPLANTLVLRADLSDDPSFRCHLERARDTVLDAQDHQDLPYERIVDHFTPEGGGEDVPLFRVMYGLRDEDDVLAGLPGPRARLLQAPGGLTESDLAFGVVSRDGALSCRLEYRTDLFEAATVAQFGGHFARLLDAATADPGLPLSCLPMLSSGERAGITSPLPPRSSEEQAPWTGLCVHELFAAQAARRPDAVALVHEATALTYRELDVRANRLAHRLRALGVGPDTLVGICLPHSADLVVGLLGILKAGGAYLHLDPGGRPEHLRHIIEDARVAHVVCTTVTRHLWDGRATPDEARSLPPSIVDLLVDGALLQDEPDTAPSTGVTPDHLAYVAYTSGTTGLPKGTLVPHSNVARLFSATDHWFGFGPQDVWTLCHSIDVDFSVWEVWGALAHGGRLVVVPAETSRSPEALHRLLREERVTVLNQSPSLFYQLAEADRDRHRAAVAAEQRLALRHVILGGETLEGGALTGWFARHGDTEPRLVTMYGSTEATVHVTCHPLTAQDVREGRGSVIGVPLPDLRLHLLDSRGRTVPRGAAGELYVSGAGLARGYLRQPELTAERFPTAVADDVADAPARTSLGTRLRLYRTGDLARVLPDGNLEYLGRVADQVALRGFRREPGETGRALPAGPARTASAALQELLRVHRLVRVPPHRERHR